jgi:hypothetical protein
VVLHDFLVLLAAQDLEQDPPQVSEIEAQEVLVGRSKPTVPIWDTEKASPLTKIVSGLPLPAGITTAVGALLVTLSPKEGRGSVPLYI